MFEKINKTLMRRPSGGHVANAKLPAVQPKGEQTMSVSCWKSGAVAAVLMVTGSSAYADFSFNSPFGGDVHVSTSLNPLTPRVTTDPVSVPLPGGGTAVVQGPSVGGVVPSTPSVQLPGETGEVGKLVNTVDTIAHIPELGQQKAASAIDNVFKNLIPGFPKLPDVLGPLQNMIIWIVAGVLGTIMTSVLLSSLVVSRSLKRSLKHLGQKA